jgi:hypothetical protein
VAAPNVIVAALDAVGKRWTDAEFSRYRRKGALTRVF